jgi:hypothetical protein
MSPGAGHGLSHAQTNAIERRVIEGINWLVHAIRGNRVSGVRASMPIPVCDPLEGDT